MFLTFAALVTLIPVVYSTAMGMGNASTRLRHVEEIEQALERSESWLRLMTELSGESSVTAALIGSRQIPDVVRSAWGFEFDAALVGARIGVDVQLARLGADDIAADLRDVRAAIDAGQLEIGQVIDELFVVRNQVRSKSIAELAVLLEAAGELEDGGEIVRAIEVASAAANLSARTSDVMTLWAGVVTPFTTPEWDDIEQFSNSLALREAAIDGFEAVVVPGTRPAAAWDELRDGTVVAEVEATFETTMSDLLDGWTNPTPAPDLPSEIPSEIIPILLDVVELVEDTVEPLIEYDLAVFDVFNIAVDDVAQADAELRAGVAADRARALLVLAGFVILVVLLLVVLSRALVRPLVRMGEAVNSMAAGDLHVRVEDSGPRELRTTAVALNEALASLQRAESVAIALSEERLDDPVLTIPMPGPLGAPLHAAVDRLAASMAERDDFRRRLEHEAAHDGLTLLANRNTILRHLTGAMLRTQRAGDRIALLFIDLDGFKDINDFHGHHVGDGLLEAVAERLTASLGEGDRAGRLGGDEFVVVAEPVNTLDDALLLAERVTETLGEPVDIDGVTVTPSVSIGVAMSRSDTITSEELMREADLALYRAKERGRGRVEVCDELLRTEVTERDELEAAIRAGLAQDEFVLFFQPVVEAETGRATSLEALIRWERPGRGLVSPDGFVSLAERSDLIVDIDRWVFGAAVRQLAEWTDHPLLGDLSVSVNVSARHLASGALADGVIAALEHGGVAPQRLAVEITENVLLEDLEHAAAELDRLRDAGVRIALDDFGAGYMSLAMLRRLQVDVLKIDRDFVRRIYRRTEQSLVELMVNTGHLLGVEVVAEGVETEEQRRVLTELGSDHLQGYLFGRPCPAPELLAVLDPVSNARLSAVDLPV